MRGDDLKTVKLMIDLYCRGKHKTEKGKLCEDCEELWRYVRYRRSKCPFGEEKPFCSNCRIHCYKPDMREKIREVMRYSGPRMIFYDPRAAWAHLTETVRRKKSEKKAKKQNAENPSTADTEVKEDKP